MPPSEPDYIFFGGASLPSAPYACTGATLWTMMACGSEMAIANFLARTINAVAGYARFVPKLGPVVFVLYIDAPALSSTIAPYCNWGTSRESDIGVWLLLSDTANAGALYWYPAYLFVDNWVALVAGREIWGFPKALGHLAITTGSTESLTLSTLAMRDQRPGDHAAEMPIFEIAPLPKPVSWLSDGQESPRAGIASITRHRASSSALPSWADRALEDFANVLQPPDGAAIALNQMLFLKQFRDCASSTAACYQQAITLNTGAPVVHHYGPLSGQLTCRLNLHTVASQPIGQDLGLNPGSQPLLPVFWVQFDFTIGFGAPLPSEPASG
ncbi:acetoacetate decarboxylase family protein [Acidiphilium sp.]|uniref:acetoacetate decarboxylase family protein n=1 Tax=Acidiphilium sp. TaxID=527 RepID=UPI003D02B195